MLNLTPLFYTSELTEPCLLDNLELRSTDQGNAVPVGAVEFEVVEQTRLGEFARIEERAEVQQWASFKASSCWGRGRRSEHRPDAL